MSNFTPDAVTEQEVRQLLKRLARLKRKWPSEPALRDLSPQMVEALDQYVDEQGRARLMATMIVVAAMLGLQFSISQFGKPPLWVDIPAVAGCLFATGLKPGHAHRYAVYALTQTDEVRLLPILIKVTDKTWGMHREVISAIKRLLSQVTEEHAGLLDRKTQERLWQLAIAPVNFKVECDEALAYAALHAFVHIGDRNTLNRMQKFVLNMTFYAPHRRVNDAVQSSIPLMEARLRRQEVPATLLRSSDVPDAATDILLRPAHAATTEPAEQLLRAGTIPQDE